MDQHLTLSIIFRLLRLDDVDGRGVDENVRIVESLIDVLKRNESLAAELDSLKRTTSGKEDSPLWDKLKGISR